MCTVLTSKFEIIFVCMHGCAINFCIENWNVILCAALNWIELRIENFESVYINFLSSWGSKLSVIEYLNQFWEPKSGRKQLHQEKIDRFHETKFLPNFEFFLNWIKVGESSRFAIHFRKWKNVPFIAHASLQLLSVFFPVESSFGTIENLLLPQFFEMLLFPETGECQCYILLEWMNCQ